MLLYHFIVGVVVLSLPIKSDPVLLEEDTSFIIPNCVSNDTIFTPFGYDPRQLDTLCNETTKWSDNIERACFTNHGELRIPKLRWYHSGKYECRNYSLEIIVYSRMRCKYINIIETELIGRCYYPYVKYKHLKCSMVYSDEYKDRFTLTWRFTRNGFKSISPMYDKYTYVDSELYRIDSMSEYNFIRSHNDITLEYGVHLKHNTNITYIPLLQSNGILDEYVHPSICGNVISSSSNKKTHNLKMYILSVILIVLL